MQVEKDGARAVTLSCAPYRSRPQEKEAAERHHPRAWRIVMLELREYQSHLVDEARDHIRAGCNAVLIQSPTASGKTVLVAHMLRNAAAKGYRSWFVVHRRELVKQSVATLIILKAIIMSPVRLRNTGRFPEQSLIR